LLVLREQHRFRLFAPAAILRVLAENGVFASLDSALVERVEVVPDVEVDTGLGVALTLLAMPGKVPLYQETARSAPQVEGAATHAARLEAGGRVCVVAPACADLTDAVVARLEDADVLFFDGTLFHDNEMIDAGLGWKTGRRMGHVSVSGAEGALARLGGLKARKIFFHINNSNPILLDDSDARRMVEAGGFAVGYDGMRVTI
jgi:pyrroloquinoline quinone biosynthesis protein B